MFDVVRRVGPAVAALLLIALDAIWQSAMGQAGAFVAPPRSISDITAILDQQKPDAAVIANRQRAASEEPAPGANGSALAEFLTRRASARSDLGLLGEAIGDAQRALETAERQTRQRGAAFQTLVSLYQMSGEPTKAITLLRQQPPGAAPASRIGMQRQLVRSLVASGDIAAAQAELDALVTMAGEAVSAASSADLELYREFWEASLESARGVVLEFRGQWREAEAAFARSESGFRAAAAKRPRWVQGPPANALLQLADINATYQSRMKREQGRLAEAEVDARRALLNTLAIVGRFHPTTATLCQSLAAVLRDQGRFAEYEALMRISLETLKVMGVPEDSLWVVTAYNGIANGLRLQGKFAEAAEAYAQQDRAIVDWPADRAARFRNELGRIFTLYAVGRTGEGLEAATAAVSMARNRGDEFALAVADGILAIGQSTAGRDPEALITFRRAAPVLLSQSSEAEEDGGVATRRQRLTARIFESYIGLMARNAATQPSMPVETFPLADRLRGRSVASALAASSARVVSQDGALAKLARREQDLRKEIAAATTMLNNLLSLPPVQRDDRTVQSIRQDIEQRRSEHEKMRLEIGVRFPAYADLIDPKPATAEQVRAALKPDEAFLSFYFGAERSFVWAIAKDGPVAFALIPATAAEFEAKVKKLREALEPNASSISDIPAFDVAVAHDLYTLLLKPVEATWRPAKTLVVATNGALGLLPLGVLPTAPMPATTDPGAAFAAYRSVRWLARTHAVSLVPSAAAFRTLRQLPASAEGRRALIGFGDPVFNAEQAAHALKAVPQVAPPATSPPLERRSAPQTSSMASATLASLPALPDTAEELRSVATALKADGKDVLNLGKAASEENVTTADLSKYRVVAFATHGLVAGELDGLTQPALALSAPAVTGGSGDGLLTLEKILALKLDADWVVLSACNTGAGDGAGAEAASGLGRAFFYAGTRAILVTNWSVHSQSARDLVTDLFRRQAADPKLSRAEALRAAMTGLMDGPGFIDGKGKTVFTYAHPLFWAPYSIIGDGA